MLSSIEDLKSCVRRFSYNEKPRFRSSSDARNTLTRPLSRNPKKSIVSRFVGSSIATFNVPSDVRPKTMALR